jgi:chaperonin GroES
MKNNVTDLKEAYVDPEKDVLYLNPNKIEASVLERMPQPTGWRILILPFQGKKTSDGGILIPEQAREREAIATVCGYVLKVGPDAYKDKSRFTGIWCKEKDWVIFGRYAGSRFKIEGGEVRLLNDDEILATIKDPTDIIHI